MAAGATRQASSTCRSASATAVIRPRIESTSPRRCDRELDGIADDTDFVAFGANLGSAGGSNALAARRTTR